MSDVFISYARSTEAQARRIADALRALGYVVWRDDELPANRPYAQVIEERLERARAVLVLWSADAVKSQWVCSEANHAREASKLVQARVQAVRPPMPFDQIQCADLSQWTSREDDPNWQNVLASIAELTDPAGAPQARPPPGPARSRAGLAWTLAAMIGVVVLALAIGGGFVAWRGSRKPAEPAASLRSVALLPIENLTGDASLDAQTDKLTQDATYVLGRSGFLSLPPRNAVIAQNGKPADEQAVGKALHVRNVVTVSLTKSDADYRISLQMVDSATGEVVTTRDVGAAGSQGALPERRLALLLFEEISHAVIKRWSDAELAKPANDQDPENLLARVYKLMVESRRQDIPQTQRMIQAARATLAGGLLADFEGRVCYYDAGLIDAGYAVSAVQRAQWAEAALDAAERSLTLRPGTSSPHDCRATVFTQLERWDEGIAEARYIIANFPLTANGYSALAQLELARGQFGPALKDFQELAARTGGADSSLGPTQLFLGDIAGATTALRDAAAADPKDPTAPFFLAAALELSGQPQPAQAEAALYRKLKTDDSAWRLLALSHEPAFTARAQVLRKALHAAGLDDPAAAAAPGAK
jgi:TolB-like protein